ncbi:MAG: alpha/beta fold hydrolase [Anaerolineae bacterium]
MSVESVKMIKVGALNVGYIEQGDGPLVLCLHGYPDTAYSWTQTLNFLAQKGYRAVAPFLRGYHPTDIPADGDYTVKQLAKDALGLIEALGEDRAIIIGHDWGALTAYSAAAIDSNKVEKLVTLDMIHPAALSVTPNTVWKGRHIIAYQFKSAAIRRVRRDEFNHIDEIYRRWSPKWNFEGETKDIKRAFAEPGRVEAALGYYWAFFKEGIGRDEQSKKGQEIALAKTTVPTLTIFGDWGALSDQQMAQSKKAFTGPYEYIQLTGVGHFLHREAPEKFFNHLSAFLDD